MAESSFIVTRMSVVDSKPALRRQLKMHRLDHGLSLEKLRNEIFKRTGIKVSPPTLSRFIENERATNDVNVHAIRRYLACFEEPKAS